MAKKKIAALLIAAAVAAGGWALPARVSAAENDGTAVTWQQDETESSEQNSDEDAAVQEQSGTSENETPAVTIPGEDNEQEPEEKLPAGWVKQEDGSWKYRKEDGTMAATMVDYCEYECELAVNEMVSILDGNEPQGKIYADYVCVSTPEEAAEWIAKRS